MDKNEYRAKLEEISQLVDKQDYKGALKIVDTIDWRRVRSARTLCMVGEIYEANKRYEDSRKLLLLAHQRAPIGKTVIYRLVELSIKMGDFDEALNYYKKFVEISPNDNSRYILKYKIYRARRSPIEEQITILQDYKSREYTERWAYELARLYAKAGMKAACIEECDDLILWFSEGKYVTKAMELKMKFAPLSASQQESYNKVKGVPSRPVAAPKTEAPQIKDSVSEQDKEIEEILNSIKLGDITPPVSPEETRQPEESVQTAEYAVHPKQPEDLPDRVAQGLRDVFQPRTTVSEEMETAATREPSTASEEQGYVIKDLEPEDMSKTTGFKPFHIGNAMTMEVKAEAPKSEMLSSEGAKAEAFKTDTKGLEFNLEALLAETANELAQAVAEETDAEEAAAEEPEEVVKEAATEEPEETAEETTTEEPEEVVEEETIEELEETAGEAAAEAVVEEPEHILPAPAAAKAAMIAENLSAVFEEKANEIEALAAEKEDAETELSETAEETEDEFSETAEETETELSDTTEETKIEVSETVEEDGENSEEPEQVTEEEIEEVTKEIPVEEVKEALGEAESHIKRVAASVVDETQKSMAFQTAVEGLMRHHLTEEEHRRLFTYFAPVPGMTQQINEALDTAQESVYAKTSQAGNIIVTGREGSGKTRLSEGLIKALCKERQMEGAKVAFITAQELNKKDPIAVVGKLSGGFLVVENAGELDGDVVENMSKAMEFKTNRLTVILEDLKPGIRSLEEKYPEFIKKFDSRIVIPVFTNDELVSFAKTYAKELGYKIDDMAVLALYTLIGDNQNEENPVAIGMVREMMDEAIKRASKKGRRVGKKVGKRHLDESGRIMLYEKDFDV